MQASLPPGPGPDFSLFGPIEEIALGRFQQIVARTLSRNAATIPHVTHHDEVDATRIEQARRRLSTPERRVTALAFLIKAVARALAIHPRFNSSLGPDGTTLILKKYFHIGVAVDTPQGLLVPVLRDCEEKAVTEIADMLSAISSKARTKGLALAEMSGGCISISSLGGIGGTAFTPIINAPEVAILGVARTALRPIWTGERFEPRPMMPLSLSYDHRVINGAEAARFVVEIGAQLDHAAGETEA